MNTKHTIIARLLCAALLGVPGFAEEPRPFVGTMGNQVIASTSGAAPDRLREYGYDSRGNVIRIAEDTFVYDTVDRVVSGTVSGRERRYSYDAFGNRLTCTDAASGADCQYGATIASATNRIAAAQYDGPGSVGEYAGQTYRYDAAGMLQSRNDGATEYVYTAGDERIAVISGGGWNWTLRDLSQTVLREASSTANMDGTHGDWRWSRDNVFRDGTLLSSVDPAATRHYHTDHLGTPRVVSDTTGQIIGVHDYFAFGLEVSGNPSETNPGRLRFTGHERDGDGLDYMHARYYEARWGRFLSVDPVMDIRQSLSEPQRWNGYGYVTNNPLSYDDPDGRERRILLLGTNSAGEMKLDSILYSTAANSRGWDYDTYRAVGGTPPRVDSGYTIDARHSLGGKSLLHALGDVDNSGTDIVVINSHGGRPLQTDTGRGQDGSGKFSFGAAEIANSLGGRPQAIVLAGCGTMDSAQAVANATGTIVFGIKSGSQAVAGQISRAGVVLANVYAATGNANFAIAVANRMLTKRVCPSNGGTCSPLPQFQVAEPRK